MSNRPDRNRQVPPSTLKSPEADQAAPPPATREVDVEEVIEERLAAARALKPDPHETHWKKAWELGRDAAIKAFDDGAEPPDVNGMSPPAEVGCRSCWVRGRDAVVKVMTAA